MSEQRMISEIFVGEIIEKLKKEGSIKVSMEDITIKEVEMLNKNLEITFRKTKGETLILKAPSKWFIT